jgi:hypothetical protein
VLEGVSRRYTAIVLLGLADEPEDRISAILAGDGLHEVCGRLIEDATRAEDLGEVALTLWATRDLDSPDAPRALDRLRQMRPAVEDYPTVELAWSLSALTVEGDEATDLQLAESIAERLLGSFVPRSRLFPHWPDGVRRPFLRSHVTCFADQVYPIQALSHYYIRTGDLRAIGAANRCAEQICELQGPAGQWWWHYDVRTGRIVERYPVYAIHQDAMGPMALFALREACGIDHSERIERGFAWLIRAPETGSSLIDRPSGLVWRKVARCEPGKLCRGVQALLSRLHPTLRMPGLDVIAQPGAVDDESRPYHMGWLLYAWPRERIRQLDEQALRLGSGSVG